MPGGSSSRERRKIPGRSKWKAPERRLSWRRQEISIGPIMAQWNSPKMKKNAASARKALNELVEMGCDMELILEVAFRLALPLTAWKSSLPKATVLESLVKALRNVARQIRHEAAFHAVEMYDQRDWWLMANMPDLLGEYEATVKKVAKELHSLSPHLRRDVSLILLGDHIKYKTRYFKWDLVADIINAWRSGLERKAKGMDSRSLEKAYQTARRSLRQHK